MTSFSNFHNAYHVRHLAETFRQYKFCKVRKLKNRVKYNILNLKFLAGKRAILGYFMYFKQFMNYNR